MKIFLTYLISITTAVILGFLGVYKLINPPRTGNLPQSTIELSITIQGVKAQPVVGARVSLFMPLQKFIGITDSQGRFSTIVKVPQGKAVVLQAEGPTYIIQKNLLIPRSPFFKAQIFLDPKEAAQGRMTLISKNAEDLARKQKSVKSPQAVQPPKKLGVNVIISSERAQESHNLNLVHEALLSLVQKKEKEFQLRKITSLLVRPLWSERAFVEIVARDEAERTLGSFLFKAGRVDEAFMTQVVDALWPEKFSKDGPVPVIAEGQISVTTSNPLNVRAYINGRPLELYEAKDDAVFKLPVFGNLEVKDAVVSLAVTADGRPLVRSLVSVMDLGRNHRWALPEPAISRR